VSGPLIDAPRVPRHRPRRRQVRRGFNLVELLLALAISAVLLTATMVALDASFRAYQMTTETVSSHSVGRLAMHRILALIRTGDEFGPFPLVPTDTTVFSDEIQFRTPSGQVLVIRYVPADEVLNIEVGGNTYTLLEGVAKRYDPPASTDETDRVKPFTLEYVLGRKLYRATIDLTVIPDDNMSTQMDGVNVDEIRLVASTMPRIYAYQ
jgi:prepilin-type N-terminal cleavage/methylation domain-containing protein